MDYIKNPVKLRAALDFIKFELTLADGSIILRDLHDISSPRDLDNRLAELTARYQPVTIRPIAVELAIDGTHISDDIGVLADFTAQAWRMNTAAIADRQRLYRTRAERVTTIPAHAAFAAALQDGWQAAEGHRWDDTMRHAYVKTTDDAARQSIRPRARLEVRLQGAACPFQTIDQLRAFDWLALAPHFRFRRVRDDLDSFSQLIADKSTTIGKRAPRTIAGSKRLYSPMTAADSALNRRYRDALRTLSRRWKRTTEPTTTQPDIAQKRGNKSGNCGQNQATTRAIAGDSLITSSKQQEQVSPQQHSNQPQQHQQPTAQASNPTTEQPQGHREAGHTAHKGTTEQDGRAAPAHAVRWFWFCERSERTPSPSPRGAQIMFKQTACERTLVPSRFRANALFPKCDSVALPPQALKARRLRKPHAPRIHPVRSFPRPSASLTQATRHALRQEGRKCPHRAHFVIFPTSAIPEHHPARIFPVTPPKTGTPAPQNRFSRPQQYLSMSGP